jgi:hypothetical protein
VAESITITDNRTGESLEIPFVNGGISAAQWSKAPPGYLVLRPGLRVHGGLRELCHLPRRRGGRPPLPRLSHRAARRELDLPRGRLPPAQRRAAGPRPVRGLASTRSPSTRSSTRTFASGSSRGSTTTPIPWACWSPPLPRCRPSMVDAKDIFDVESRSKQIIRLIAKMPTLAAAAHRFSVGMPFVYPDNSLDVHLELPVHDVEDRRAPLRCRSHAGPGARRAVHPPRRPRAELLDHRHAGGGLLPRRPLLGMRRRRRRPLRPAPRWGQRGGHPHAHRNRLARERGADFIKSVKEPVGGQAAGLRAPGLQELRPPGQDHQEDGRRGVRDHRQEPAPRHRVEARGDRPG